MENYTADDTKYKINDPYIKNIVQDVVGGINNILIKAIKLHDYVIDNLEYSHDGKWDDAVTALKRGNGSCSEYSFVYIAMCRAAGLPARYVGSVVVRGDDASFDDVFHRWVEVYLPNYGWIPVDPSGGDKASPRDQANYFGHLSNRFLITTENAGGSEYMGWTYNSNAFYTSEPKSFVVSDHYSDWKPLK